MDAARAACASGADGIHMEPDGHAALGKAIAGKTQESCRRNRSLESEQKNRGEAVIGFTPHHPNRLRFAYSHIVRKYFSKLYRLRESVIITANAKFLMLIQLTNL